MIEFDLGAPVAGPARRRRPHRPRQRARARTTAPLSTAGAERWSPQRFDDGGGDPLATKLALAEEFNAIGDAEGARGLAEEVLAEASGDLEDRGAATARPKSAERPRRPRRKARR